MKHRINKLKHQNKDNTANNPFTKDNQSSSSGNKNDPDKKLQYKTHKHKNNIDDMNSNKEN